MNRKGKNWEPEATGFVLAGGWSSRMGMDKATVLLAGQPLIVHALEILREAGLTAAIAGASTQLSSFAPVVPDTEQDQGPLGGICAALASTTSQRAVFLPVDLPLLPASLLTLLLERSLSAAAAMTVVEVNGFVQTFPAVIEQRALAALRGELAAGKGGCLAAFHAAARVLGKPVLVLPLETAVRAGHVVPPQGLAEDCWFLNINTAADLVRAEACLARRIA